MPINFEDWLDNNQDYNKLVYCTDDKAEDYNIADEAKDNIPEILLSNGNKRPFFTTIRYIEQVPVSTFHCGYDEEEEDED